jgi:hypothetical protein
VIEVSIGFKSFGMDDFGWSLNFLFNNSIKLLNCFCVFTAMLIEVGELVFLFFALAFFAGIRFKGFESFVDRLLLDDGFG